MTWVIGLGAFLRRVPAWVWAVVAVPIVIALVALFVIRASDRKAEQAVTTDRSAVEIEARTRQLEAERAATIDKERRDQAAAVTTQELRNEVAKGVAEPVGPGTAAVLARMREQQAKGRR